MKKIYVTSRRKGTGVTSFCAGLAGMLREKGKNAGYCKPVYSGTQTDDAVFMKETLSLEEPVEAITPSIDPEDTAALKAAIDGISSNKDIVLVEGNPNRYLSSAKTAAGIGASLLVVEPYEENLSRAILDFRSFGNVLSGTIINKAPVKQNETFRSQTQSLSKVGIRFFGAIPEDRKLYALTIRELAECINAEVIGNTDGKDKIIENVMLGAMSVDTGTDYLSRKDNKAVITRRTRPDIQLASLKTSTACLVLTGEGQILPVVKIKAEEKSIPVLVTGDTTSEVIRKIEVSMDSSRLNQETKLDRFVTLMKQNLDIESLYKVLGI